MEICELVEEGKVERIKILGEPILYCSIENCPYDNQIMGLNGDYSICKTNGYVDKKELILKVVALLRKRINNLRAN